MYGLVEYITEVEAKNKICCAPYNTTQTLKCKASECMAWSWEIADHLPVFIDYPSKKEPPRPSFIPSSWTWIQAKNFQVPSGWLEPEEEALNREKRGIAGF